MVLYQSHLLRETFLLSDYEAKNYDATWKARVTHIHSACINHTPPLNPPHIITSTIRTHQIR